MDARPEEYLAIAMWCRMLEGTREYTRKQQELAAADNAPIDALYKHNGGWICVPDLDEDHLFRIAYETKFLNGELMPEERYLKVTITTVEYYALPADATEDDWLDIFSTSEALCVEQDVDAFDTVDSLPGGAR